MTGSSDLYGHNGRLPYASINFTTAHDGFTLHDLVSYNEKHNEANGEDNRDGHNENLSWNCGAEGETDDAEYSGSARAAKKKFPGHLVSLARRADAAWPATRSAARKAATTTPIARTTKSPGSTGSSTGRAGSCSSSRRFLIGLRQSHPVLRRRHFFQGRKIRGSEVKDLAWFRPDGKEMSDEDWSNSESRCFGLRLAGDAIEELDDRGNRIIDDTLLILLNAHHEAVPFTSAGAPAQGPLAGGPRHL